MNVRRMTDLDRGAVANLHRRSARELGTAAYDDRTAKAWAGDRCRCDYDLNDPDATFVVAVTAPDETRAPRVERSPGGGEGDVAGFGHLQVDDGEVQAVYVSPTYAGEGVGTQLLEHLEARAREHGLDALSLASSLNAVGFYEYHDYAVTDVASFETKGNGVTATVDVRVMEKSLRSDEDDASGTDESDGSDETTSSSTSRVSHS
ncbi:GNAT family N-acetyltransferase [Halorubellus sp. JP-L1]|uniref:GNAT family N-acetyltransferase n=1 Tax=Halorubellus sp. JP-L1 TaxID=2715753 RepID=UPI0014089059|nr:GNAT family N-acetyltransferase [Halorubellus sp. JP-L1]NHN41951.1 GNAT family N-acetyltransferase [Halorubellus sp. JP-L1]